MAMGDDKSLGVMISKREAAKFLGVSTRAINRYCADGRLKVTHFNLPNGGDGPAMFDPSDLEAFRNAPKEPVKRDSQALVKPGKEAFENALVAFLESRGKARQHVPFEARLTLNLEGAAELAGYSKDYLRKAIKEGKLKAAIRGRGWNIKRADLEAWVAKL